MFCQECPDRDRCQQICPALEAHLWSLHGYQREIPMSPYTVNLISGYSLAWRDLQPDRPFVWDLVREGLKALPPELHAPFHLHFHEHLSVIEIASALGIHRSTAYRRLQRAVTIVKQELERAGAVLPQPEPDDEEAGPDQTPGLPAPFSNAHDLDRRDPGPEDLASTWPGD